MKKLLNLILFVVTSLLLLSCEKEKEKIEGAYPYDEVVFLYKVEPEKRRIVERDSILVFDSTPFRNWNTDLYPITFWVDNEEIATISPSGYLKGKKEGTVTVYAKVMSVYGLIESSIKYDVKDFLKDFTKRFPYALKDWGFDLNNDDTVTIAELQMAEKHNSYISSDDFFALAQYLPNLKEINIRVDTSSRVLDLSAYEFKQVRIHDRCYEYAKDYGVVFPENYQIDNFQKHFLTDIILNHSIETLLVSSIPGIKTLDLQQYTNLKTFKRLELHGDNDWVELEVLLPKSIINVDVYRADLIINDILPNLENLRYDLTGYEDVNKRKVIELNKKLLPNLNIIKTLLGIRYLDISSYEANDLDSIYVFADTLCLSESMWLTNNRAHDFAAFEYIIK